MSLSKYVLSDCENYLLTKGLNFSIPCKKLDHADYLVQFELFFRDIRNLDILSYEDKLQIVFKSQNKLAKAFRCKDRIPKELTSGVVYKFQYGLCNESYESIRHLDVRIGEHIGISPLPRKKVKPKGSGVSHHLLFCNNSPSFENFSVLTKENKKFLLKLKERLLIMRDKPSLNRNIRSALLYLFDKV